MSLGPELVTNGTFPTNLNGWTYPGGVVWVSPGLISFGNGTFIEQDPIALVAGKVYRLEFSCHGDGIHSFNIKYNLASGNQATVSGNVGETINFSQDFLVSQADIDIAGAFIELDSQTPSTLYVTSVSVREYDSANLYLQTVQLVGAETSDVQTLNAGKDDDGTPIYYELETQGLEFGNVFHRKKISDKIVVFTKDGIDSAFLGKSDDNDYKNIEVDLSRRVNIGQVINLEGNTMRFKWFGEADEATPILEGFYIEKVEDVGIVKN